MEAPQQPQQQQQQEQFRPPNPNQGLIDTLEQELQHINHEITPTVYGLVENELFKLRGGVTELIYLVGGPDKIKVRARVYIPQDSQNYVGRLLGPKGETLKNMQTSTQTKMAILGHGSMRDLQKENELLASGDPKYQHLKQELHLQIDSFAPPSEAYYRVSHALAEVQKTVAELINSQPPAWGPPQGQMQGYPQGQMPRGGGPGRGRGGPPMQSNPMNYGGPPPFQGNFGGGYGNGNAGGKMPPMRGRGRGMPSRPYSRGRGGRP